MAGAVRTDAYLALLRALVRFRKEAGLSQAALALRLDKPPSFVAKFELGERRLDVVELLVLLRELEVDPLELIPLLQDELPKRL